MIVTNVCVPTTTQFVALTDHSQYYCEYICVFPNEFLNGTWCLNVDTSSKANMPSSQAATCSVNTLFSLFLLLLLLLEFVFLFFGFCSLCFGIENGIDWEFPKFMLIIFCLSSSSWLFTKEKPRISDFIFESINDKLFLIEANAYE